MKTVKYEGRLDLYVCESCPFDTFDKAEAEQHKEKHPAPPAETELAETKRPATVPVPRGRKKEEKTDDADS